MIGYAETLEIATCLVVLVSLWIRRKTWRYRWEQPKTIGLTFIAVGVTLKAPPISWLIGRPALSVLIAHVFILCGIGAIAYSAEHKLRSDSTMRSWHITRVLLPKAAGVAVMVGLFVGGASHGLDRYFESTGGPAMAYWIVYDILLMYLLMLVAQSLYHLLYDPPSRFSVQIYLTAVIFEAVAVACRIAVLFEPNVLLTGTAMTANAIALCLFAGGAAYQWRDRLYKINRYLACDLPAM